MKFSKEIFFRCSWAVSWATTWVVVILFSAQSLFALTLPIKEVVRIGTMRENQLFGYGLVVGLPQTGDTRSVLTNEMLKRVLSFKGMVMDDIDFKSKNIAVVMVTAKVPSVALSGDLIDIWVSSIGNAKSLKGGYLLQTPLSGADSRVYAVAQGSISPAKAPSQTRRGSQSGKTTTSFISNGAIIERKITHPLTLKAAQAAGEVQRSVKLNLIHFDVNTIHNIIEGINKAYPDSASLSDDGSITVGVPQDQESVKFLSEILKIPVRVENKAKVVIDPRSGTIVMGGNVGLSQSAISSAGMSIQIGLMRPRDENEKKKKPNVMLLEESPTVAQLVDILNKLGLDAQSIVDILKALHSAGALHAELLII